LKTRVRMDLFLDIKKKKRSSWNFLMTIKKKEKRNRERKDFVGTRHNLMVLIHETLH